MDVAPAEFSLPQALYGLTLQPLVNAARKTAIYIINNRTGVLAFIFGWGVIFCGMGLLHGGFSDSSILEGLELKSAPLAIGFGCGMALGIGLGALIVKCRVPQMPKDVSSIWGVINYGLNAMPANGTRLLCLWVAGYVLLAAMEYFPEPTGWFLGIVSGNHVATQIMLYDPRQKAQHNPELTLETLQSRVGHLETRVQQLEHPNPSHVDSRENH